MKLRKVFGYELKSLDLKFYHQLKEFPWKEIVERIMGIQKEELIEIIMNNDIVGAFYLRYPEHTYPELVFFEIEKTKRGKGYGRVAIRKLFRYLLEKGYTSLYIQTMKREIYSNMKIKFRPAPGGLIVNLLDPFENYEEDNPDATLTIIYTPMYLIHDIPEHPERSERIEYTYIELKRRNLLKNLALIPPRLAEEREVEEIHSPEHIKKVEEYSKQCKKIAVDTPTYQLTFKAALLSFGGALKAGEIIEKRKKVFVLSRPPGHHAHRNFSHGFCFFNNIAGLAWMLYKNGYKPLIIDWDAHHGDGTQEILYDKPITYISLHQKFLFPNTGKEEEKGEGEGKGYNYNFPLPTGCEDELYLTYFKGIENIIKEKKPDIILVSAGQDGHREDKYSGLNLTSNIYRKLGKIAADWANKYTQGKLILVLEGGYNLEILAVCNANICEGILESSLNPDGHQ